MKNTAYKNQFNAIHYDRIHLTVPKGMKDSIKNIASEKGKSVNAYIIDLIRQDQMEALESLQIAEKNKEQIISLLGNTHDGYDITFKDGCTIHCRTKLEVRKTVISHLSKHQ